MINKKSFLIRDYVIATILFSAIIALMVISIASIASEYSNTQIIDPTFRAKYDKLSSQLGDISSMRSSAQSTSGLNFLGAFDVALGATISTIQLVLGSVTMYSDMTANMIEDFTFIPSEVLTILFQVGLAVIVIYLVFVWFSSVSRGRI